MTSLYMVFIDAPTPAPLGTGPVNARVTYGTSFNPTTGEIYVIGTKPVSETLTDFYTGVDIPSDFNGISGSFDHLYVQSGGATIGTCYFGGGYVQDTQGNFIGGDQTEFGVCSGSSHGNFLNRFGTGGTTKFIIVPNDPSAFPYSVYLVQ